MNALNIVFGLSFVIAIVIAFILLLPRILYGKIKYNDGRKCDCIIILSYHVPVDGKPSPILIERINKGIELYRLNIAQKIICAGGAVRNANIESEVMFKELLKNGIPKENIICEKESKGTWGNIKHSKEIMKNNGFKTAVIVSSPWHLRRASIYATEMGIKHTVEKSDIPKGIRIFFWIVYLYIYYGIIKYLLNKEKYIK
ncbi:MAG: YdcF family protein [Bacillota bacterium]|nr:YdcF family protein [Bacillota bacterium]